MIQLFILLMALAPNPTYSASKASNQEMVLNHVGISVSNFEETVTFFAKILGIKEAFTIRDNNGKPLVMYLQVSQSTFIELLPAKPERPPGLNHIGLQVKDVTRLVSTLRKNGLDVAEPRLLPSQVTVTNVNDPNGAKIELMELKPGSLQRKAIDGWVSP